MNYWASTFVPWEAQFDFTFYGAIDAHMAVSVVIENNFVGGSQRSGILYNGGLCPGTAFIQPGMNHSIKNNIVHSALAGVTTFPGFTYASSGTLGSALKCVSISGFTIFKSVNWGIYYQNPPSVIFDSNVLVDNKVGILPYVLGPGLMTHMLTGKTVTFSNSIVVGRSSRFNCLTDSASASDLNMISAWKSTPFGSGVNGKGVVGVTIGNFIGSNNKAPIKPWFVKAFYLI